MLSWFISKKHMAKCIDDHAARINRLQVLAEMQQANIAELERQLVNANMLFDRLVTLTGTRAEMKELISEDK